VADRVEESELLEAMGQVHEQSTFLDGVTTPVLFGSAVLNFGVRQLLDTLLSLAPARRRGPTCRAAPRRWTSRSARSSSRSRPGWTPRTATGWPTSGSAPASSSAAPW
jgi:peptide subunit release factor RF-3